jgi:methylenetetrahydrofolate reductase (NADPH)
MAHCSKHARNGPCGGSCGGQCELLDKDCFWARVYERLKYFGESEKIFSGPEVFYDARLQHTSAWANTYLDRDHFGRQIAAEAATKRGLAPDDPQK